MITQAELQKRVVCIKDGLYWVKPPKSYPQLMGKRCGSEFKAGTNTYRYVSINNKRYLEHRLVYLWAYGYMPKEIDHKDGNGVNNSLRNLRPCTRQQNNFNTGLSAKNKSGHKNVHLDATSQKWVVTMKVNGVSTHFGRFYALEDAVKAAQEAREQHHGNYSRQV